MFVGVPIPICSSVLYIPTSVCFTNLYLPTYLPTCVCRYTYPYVCFLIFLSVLTSVCLFFCPYLLPTCDCVSIYLYICLSVSWFFSTSHVRLFVCMSNSTSSLCFSVFLKHICIDLSFFALSRTKMSFLSLMLHRQCDQIWQFFANLAKG